MADLESTAKLVGGNPFHFNPAISDEFVGRWSLVREMVAELNAGQISYACIGGRRFGKTSLLGVLRELLGHPTTAQSFASTLPLLIDPMMMKFTSAEHFFATLLQQICRWCDTRLPEPPGQLGHVRVSLDGISVNELLASNPPGITAVQFSEVMNVILDRLADAGGPRRLIILLDEVDSLLDYPWHKDLFAQLRASLVSGDLRSRLRLVLAGSQRFLEEATDRGSPLWNVLSLQYLTALDESSTYKLAERAPELSESVLQAIWKQSGGHPFLARYLLHHLWKSGSAHAMEADVTGLVDQFFQQEANHLEGWSRAIGLAGLQIYGLFVDTTDWIERRAIVRAVNNAKIPVPRALTALCYHGLISPNPTWSQFRLTGNLFRDWYVQEIPRLIADLTPPNPTSLTNPTFWVQLISNGSLQTVFGNKEVVMGNRTTISNVSGSIINFDSMLEQVTQTISTLPQADQASREDLTKLVAQLTELLKQTPADKAEDAGKIADRVDTVVKEAAKPKPDKEKVEFSLESLKKAAENIASVVPAVLPIAMQVVEHIRKLIP